MILLDAADTVLGGFAPAFSARAQTHLISMGVEVQLGARVVGVDHGGLDVRNRDGTHRRIHSPYARSGQPVSPATRSGHSSPNRPAPAWIAQDGWRCWKTSPCPVTPRFTWSAI